MQTTEVIAMILDLNWDRSPTPEQRVKALYTGDQRHIKAGRSIRRNRSKPLDWVSGRTKNGPRPKAVSRLQIRSPTPTSQRSRGLPLLPRQQRSGEQPLRRAASDEALQFTILQVYSFNHGGGRHCLKIKNDEGHFTITPANLQVINQI